MASLRTRVLVSVLVLAAAGMIIVAAVTYAEQRSFLEGRVTTEVRAAGPAMTHALHEAGYGRTGQAPRRRAMAKAGAVRQRAANRTATTSSRARPADQAPRSQDRPAPGQT